MLLAQVTLTGRQSEATDHPIPCIGYRPRGLWCYYIMTSTRHYILSSRCFAGDESRSGCWL